MNILRLNLLAFGPFTNHELTLAEGLHIVYGPNEAGKSSTLRALRSLLYGFDARCPDSFLHPYKDLRVGAVLRGADGQTLECIRRKGNRNTLRAIDDAEIIDESQLTRLLGGVGEDAFSRQFGINHAQLVAGGSEIVKGGGEIGQILFAAASGFAHLNEVRRALAEEAEGLFTPAAAVKPINKAITELKEQRKRVQESQLKSNEWKARRDALAAAEASKKELEAQHRERGAELVRLQRIARALPDIAKRRETLDELAKLQGVPALAPDFGERRRAAEKQWTEAKLRSADAAESLASLAQEMEGLDVSEPILARKVNIEALYKSLAIHLKAEDDSRMRLVPQRDQLLRDVEAILRDLGREDLTAKNADQLRLTREERMRIQRLGADYAGLIGRVEAALQRLAELREESEATREELQQLPASRDVAPLRRTLSRLQKQGDLAGRRRALEQELSRARRQAQLDLKKLPLWEGELEALEALAVPCDETIAEFEERLEAAKNEQRRMTEQLAEARRQLSEQDQRLRQLDLEHDVPTEEALTEARRRREEGWRLLRALLRDGEAPSKGAEAFLAQFPGADTLEAAYERSVADADSVADRLRREAERVGMKSQLTAQRDKYDKRCTELEAAVENAGARLQAEENQWRQQWTPLGIEPLSPREMRAWADRHADLAKAAEATRRLADEAAELGDLIASFRRELFDCLERLDVYPEWDEAPLDDLAEMCEATIEEAQQTEKLRQQLERDAARQAKETKAAEDDCQQAQQALEAWRTQWAAATERLQLQNDAEPAVAAAVLDEIDKLSAKIHEAEGLTERIEAIAGDAQLFAQNVRNVCEGAAPDLAHVPYAKATVELEHRLEKARKASDRLAELQSLRARAEQRQAAAEEELLQGRAALERLCGEAGCESPGELAAIEQQAQRQRDLRRRLEEIEDRLHQEAAGKPLSEFVREALAEDADQLAAAVAQLQQQMQEATSELEQVNQTIGQERTELARMDGSAAAAAAQEVAEQLSAQLRDGAERYVRLRLAAEVLQAAIQRHREKNQGPVLRRASDLFRDLTLGSFSGLKVDYNDAGQALLVGVRPSGQTVTVEGMSDGCCDQLYLALRLASLEHYLDSHPPLPFVVDDILITFDDERAVAALRALCDLSRRTQVIFFTHHRRLVELAQKHLPKRHAHLHRLPGPLEPEPNGESQEETRERTLFA